MSGSGQIERVDASPEGRAYLVVNEALRLVPGDRIWHPEHDQLLVWPAELAGNDSPGLVVTATVNLFRRRPAPGPVPSVQDWLVRHPYATYCVRAEGRSMTDHGIHHGSLLVVDRRCELYDRDIVIAGSSEGFLVKQFRLAPPRLVAGSREYPDIVLGRSLQYQLDGVVIASLTHWLRS